jgi:putative phosphoesterase
VKPTSVAALYDIHGNLPALEAVLAEVPEGATIVVGGDVALGGFPHQTLELLRSLGERVLWVRGNCDRELTPGEAGFVSMEALAWVRSRLSDEQITFLHGLPPQIEFEVDGVGRVLFCHASPRNDVDIFIATTPEEHVAPLFVGVSADLVVVGHNHVQFERTVRDIRVVNAGSVGLSNEDEPGRGVHKLSRVQNPSDLQEDRISAPHGVAGSSPATAVTPQPRSFFAASSNALPFLAYRAAILAWPTAAALRPRTRACPLNAHCRPTIA